MASARLPGRQLISGLLASLLATVAAAPLTVPDAARAQTLRGQVFDGPLPPLRPSRMPRPVQRAGSVPTEAIDATTSTAPVARANDLAAHTEGDEDAAAQPPSGTRSALRDGEHGPIEGAATAPTDGVLEAEPEYRNPDGSDSVMWDARPQRDRRAFDAPPAGHDAEAFAAEVSPHTDRRPRRIYSFDPWQPRGITLGNFIVFPVIDIGAVWNSNLLRSQAARADQGLELRPSVRLRSNWRTHALEASAAGGLSYFDKMPSEDDRAYELDARGRLDITRRTQLSGQLRRNVVQESRGTLDSRLRTDGRADVVSDEARIALSHRFNRLEVALRGSVINRDFEAQASGSGSRSQPDDRDVRVSAAAARASWSFKPTLIAFAEAEIDDRDFRSTSFSDGIARDSTGERYRAGIGFGNTGQVLRGEISLGYGRQRPDDARLATIDGLLIEANIGWRIDALNALLVRASSDVTDTAVAGSAGGLSRRISAELRHAFLRQLIGTAGIAHSATTYQGVEISEHLTETTLGLEYYLGPEAILFGRWQHASYRSSAAGADWSGDEVRIGVRLRR